MRRLQSGFTLIELMIVIAIIGLLAAVLVPEILGQRDGAYAIADNANLQQQYKWMSRYQSKHKGALPSKGGHKFVLELWTSKIFDHTPENFDRFFTPGPARDLDPEYQEKYKMILAGDDPWPSIQDVDTIDTHYVGRAREHMRSALQNGNEAWMANDNEGIWSLRDGTINVLFCSSSVRQYSYQQLQELYGLGDFDPENPVQTWGEDSPIEPCRKLDR